MKREENIVVSGDDYSQFLLLMSYIGLNLYRGLSTDKSSKDDHQRYYRKIYAFMMVM